ncbi:MAG: hypothetical protein V3W34_19220 [Phycisphaerae bacterium]
MPETVERLGKLLERYQRRRRGVAGKRRASIPTGISELDEALPHGGLPAGSVIEVLSGGSGSGARTLALRIAIRAACVDAQSAIRNPQSAIRNVVVVDRDGDFYPPAAVALGLAVDRLLVVRVRGPAEAFWATDQALRCRAVGAVVATRLELDSARSRRLQLAAEGSGGVALVLGLGSGRRHTFAAVQLLVEPVSPVEVMREFSPSPLERVGDPHPAGSAKRQSHFSAFYQDRCASRAGRTSHISAQGGAGAVVEFSRGRRCLIRVLKVPEGRPVEPVVMGLSDETFDVSLSAVSADRAAGNCRRLSA